MIITQIYKKSLQLIRIKQQKSYSDIFFVFIEGKRKLVKNRRMLKKLTISLSLILLFLQVVHSAAQQLPVVQVKQPKLNNDTIVNILTQQDAFLREKRLISFTKNYIQGADSNKLLLAQDTLKNYFTKYNLPNRDIFNFFIKSVAFNKQHDLKQAELYMAKALQIAEKNNQDYLTFQCLSHLGFILTDKGDYIGAIYNYRLATIQIRKLKDKFKDNRREAALNINISDLFYKSGLYRAVTQLFR